MLIAPRHSPSHQILGPAISEAAQPRCSTPSAIKLPDTPRWDFRKARAFLSELSFYELGGYKVCLQAARNYRALRAKGITVHKTIDVIIATGCIEWNLELLHNDRDFDLLRQIAGLLVVPEKC